MADNKPKAQLPERTHLFFDISNPDGRWNWFLMEFWPMILMAAFFLIMMAFPLTLSGMLHNPFSSADIVWGGYGLLLILEFIGAVAIVCLCPSWLGIYMFFLALWSLGFAEGNRAWFAGNTPWGNSITILFLTYVAIGNLVFFNALRSQRKRKS